jgi:hypothetical protein
MGMHIKLRDFANLDESQVLRWRGLRLAAQVEDDFGKKVNSDTFALMLTWQGLVVHRMYNDLKYSVDELIPSNKADGGKNVVYEDKTLATPLNWTLQQVMPHINDPVENDRIKRAIHIWQNKLNNLIVVMSEGYEISATAESVAELMEDDGIMDIRQQILDKKVSIDDGEKLFATYIKEAPSLNHNTMALLARTGGVSINQAFQTTIIRGAVFDLNNTINPNPVMVPYAHGITNVADSLGERNASGKSLINNGKGLKDAEWFHRKIHLLSAPLHSVGHLVDCGTTVGMPIKIPNLAFALSLMGKFRIMDDGAVVLIDQTNVGQIKAGDTVTVRSMAFCNSTNAGKPCGKCYGMMKSAIPHNTIMGKDANAGMYSGTTLCNPMGQKMLSTKHFIRNATSRAFVPHTRDKDIIFSNGDEIFLREEICTPGSELVLRSDIVKSLSDLKSLDMLDGVGLDKLPYFSEVTFRYEVEDIMMGGKTTQQHAATTSVSSRNARFSLDFLKYVLDRGWKVVDKRFIAVDLSEWNSLAPMFSLPYTREDLDMHRARVENFMTFNKRNTAWRNQVVTPKIFGEVLSEFWTLINQEITGINAVHIESLLYCCLAKDPNNLSYAMVNGPGDKYFTSFVNCITNRGGGGLFIYEKQQNVLNESKTFMMMDRQGSVLESFWSLAAT